MVFATSAMLCWGQKSTKIDPTSFQKQLSNPCSNLHRFESQLDSILGGFWGSRWSPIRSKRLAKSIPKTIQKMITFWIASRWIFAWFWAPTWPPRRETTIQILEHFSLLGPSWAKDTPKTPPRGLLGPILNDFDIQLGGFWTQVERFSTPNLVDLAANPPANQPTKQPNKQPNDQTSRQPLIPRPGGGWAEGNWILVCVVVYVAVYVVVYDYL